MQSELVVDVQQSEVQIALLENKELVEIHREKLQSDYFSVGDIYLGRVKKIMPGLNAAFIDIGHEKDAFLHYLDLGPHFRLVQEFTKQTLADRRKTPSVKFNGQTGLEKNGTIAEILNLNDLILVQITKEPISTKGPRLTAEISIAGRNMVLLPFTDKISVSQKIDSKEEKTRLRQLINSIKPKGYGTIIRTVAEGKLVAELNNELRVLVKRWDDLVVRLQQSKGVGLLCEEMGRTIGIIRDIFNADFEHIHVNDREFFREIQDYVSLIAPERKGIVKFYNSDVPIMDHFGLTKRIKSSFGRMVPFKSTAYLVVEHTEAMHVIDVNSGVRSRAQESQETNAMEVNMLAAEEVARQLRLRDMGGIIVVDFIDLGKAENRQLLYDKMRDLMSKDRARHNILPLSKFGLMQITRQRTRPAMHIITEETCPTCYGKGKIKPSILFTDQIEEKIALMVNTFKRKKFVLYVHPYVEAFIKKGVYSLLWQWKFRYGFGVKIVASQKMGFLEYKFYDKKRNEIELI